VLLEPFPDIDTPLDLATFWLEFAPRADVRHWESWKLLSEGDLIQRVQAVDEEGA
jgi:hypothetical protein